MNTFLVHKFNKVAVATTVKKAIEMVDEQLKGATNKYGRPLNKYYEYYDITDVSEWVLFDDGMLSITYPNGVEETQRPTVTTYESAMSALMPQ